MPNVKILGTQSLPNIPWQERPADDKTASPCGATPKTL